MLRVNEAELSIVRTTDGLLGRGSFGEVRRARLRGENVAVKTLYALQRDSLFQHTLRHEDRPFVIQKFLDECATLSALRHSNIVRFIAVAVTGDDSPVFLILELLSQTLEQLLRAGPPARTVRLSILRDVACGLSALHERRIIHRDLKSSNVLLDADGVAKLSDVGEAFELSDGRVSATMTAGHGTPLYMAPEMNLGGKKTTAIDMFSLGVLMVEVDTGVSPPSTPGPAFADDGTLGSRAWIPEVQRRAADLEKMTTPTLRTLAHWCLHDQALGRPKATDVHAVLDDVVEAEKRAEQASLRAMEADARVESERQRGADAVACAQREHQQRVVDAESRAESERQRAANAEACAANERRRAAEAEARARRAEAAVASSGGGAANAAASAGDAANEDKASVLPDEGLVPAGTAAPTEATWLLGGVVRPVRDCVRARPQTVQFALALLVVAATVTVNTLMLLPSGRLEQISQSTDALHVVAAVAYACFVGLSAVFVYHEFQLWRNRAEQPRIYFVLLCVLLPPAVLAPLSTTLGWIATIIDVLAMALPAFRLWRWFKSRPPENVITLTDV